MTEERTIGINYIEIQEEQVTKAIKEMRNGKAPGPGGIPVELIKNGTPKLYRMITKLMNKCINEGNIPKEWKTGYISPIHKKGKRDICDNYRGIAVTSTFSKIYGRIIRDLIEQQYQAEEAEEQSGFRAGRSCLDNLFCLTQIVQKKLATGRELHLVFLDIAKACDNVPQKKLWNVMESSNINSTLVRAVKNLYDNQTARVKVGAELTTEFKVTKGLRQGCCISPTLFKIYIEKALEQWKRKSMGMGIPLDEDTTLYTLQFADDQIIMAQEIEDIEYMTRKAIEEYDKWGLKINVNKSAYLSIGYEQDALTLETGETIPACEEYKYLGATVGKQGLYNTEVKERIKQGRKVIGALNGILWDANISKKNKKQIYSAMVQSVALYGSEIWQLSEQHKNQLKVMEMDYWRRAAGISRRDRVRNTRIREIMDAGRDIVEEIEKRQLLWYGHVERMGNNRLPKKAMEWQPRERRKRGRPRRGWNEEVESLKQKWDIQQGAWMNRQEWKKILNSGRPR